MKIASAIIYLAAGFLLSGCGAGRILAVKTAQPFLVDAMRSIMQESDPELARTAMASDLKLLEAMLHSSPENIDLLTIAAQGFTGYAMLFYDPIEPNKARSLYKRARDYGLRALGTRNSVLSNLDSKFDEFEGAIKSLNRKDVPVVYWTAMAWGGMINVTRDDPLAFAGFARVRLLMDWVSKQDPQFFFSGPDWFYGAYYSTLPPIVGGDPKLSKQHFERAINSTNGNFLMGKLYYAQYYAVQTMDRPLYERLLHEIIDTKKDLIPEATLLNVVARERARKLLLTMDELF